jgi:hypothetical protein
MRIKTKLVVSMLLLFAPNFLPASNYLGNYNNKKNDPNSVNNKYGTYGSPYSSNSVNNQHGPYGSPYSDTSANNPYATNAPKLYDKDGNYRGKLSTNPYDPDSISNPYGKYGNPYSPDSVNNPNGPGNPSSSNEIQVFGE